MKRERSDSLNDSHIDNNTIQQWQAKNDNMSSTDIYSQHTSNDDKDNSIRNPEEGITCDEAPCSNNFIKLEHYTNHVENYHNNRCSKCQQNFVSNYILNLHINECHNPFINEFEQLSCFEPNCDVTFDTHQQRVQHLIEKHQYPPFFDFDMIFSGY